ncbi:MAG: alpha-amylase family glycosyl hydrolase [Clostridia bacterium]|nr:alpha-amylase family glycosyl hydrolase [Clostridia bacterium]
MKSKVSRKFLSFLLVLAVVLSVMIPAGTALAADVNYTITYTDTSVSTIYVHWGVNGWTNVQDTLMTNKGSGNFEAVLTVPSGTTINYCYHITSPSDYWNNNGGANWSVVVTGPSDTTAPTVSLTAPTAGATVSGSAVTLSANAADAESGVSKVEFYNGTTLIGTDTTSPYSITWDTSTIINSTYSLTAKAYNGASLSTTSTAVSVTVRNTSTNANLSALALTGVTLSPTFAAATTTYTSTVANSVSSTTVTPTVQDINATYVIKKNGTTVTNPVALDVGTNTITVEVTASDAATKKTYTVTVTRQAATAGLTVHVKKPSTWATTVKIYYWNTVPTTVTACAAWPGNAMTSEGNDWYVYTIPGATSASIVFNDGAGKQTADLSRSTTEGWYYTDNVWYNVNPEIPVITATPAAGTYGSTQSVALNSSNTADKIYYTTNGTTPTTSSTLYTAPISVSASTTIKAFGVNTYSQSGSVYTFAYVIDPNLDTEPPTITASLPTGQSATSVSVNFTIRDNKAATTTAYYTTNGTEPTTSSPVYVSGNASAGLTGASITVSQSTTFKFLVKDGAGNTTTQSFYYNIGSYSRSDFREDTIYFLMTTRFYDGDTSNNVHAWDDATAKNPDSDPAWRGDFKGLIQKLDYIKALGFSAIWITPVVQNASGYDYHGYHAINFKKVDPRYESADTTYQDLITAAHAKGIKVIQDIVLNHTGNFGEENLFPMFKKDPTKADTAANLVKITTQLPANYDTMTPAQQYDARINLMKTETTNNNKYHTEKSLSWESYTVQTGQIAGDCVDLNTEEPTVAQYLIDAYNQYIDMGVDAFRVDTVKHINRYIFNKYFNPAFMQRGGSNFFMFGETCSRYRNVWNSGIPSISSPFYTWKESKTYAGDGYNDYLKNKASVEQNWADNSTTTGQPESNNHYLNGNDYHTPDYSRRSYLDQIDFPMHWAFRTAQEAFAMNYGDKYYNDATWNVTYVDSHDYAPDGAPENQRFAGTQDTWAENLSLMFTFRGIPCIYYGSEIEFMKGAPIDVGPNAPLSTTGRAYFGGNIEGSVTVTGYGQYTNATGTMATTLSHPLAQHIRRLNLIRRAVPALQKGQYSLDGISGSMAFKRRFTDTTKGIDSFVLVTISGDATFTGIPNGTYKDAITGTSVTVTNGTLTATCSGKGNMRVYVLNGPGKIGDTGTYLK